MRQPVHVMCDRCHRERDLRLAPVCLLCGAISATPVPPTVSELDAAILVAEADLQSLRAQRAALSA